MLLKIFFILSIFLLNLCHAGLEEDWQKAKAIAESRLQYYTTRGELLNGTDAASIKFQEELSSSNTHVTTNLGAEFILSLISGKTELRPELLRTKREANDGYIQDWKRVLGIIQKIHFTGNRKVRKSDFDKILPFFDQRAGVTSTMDLLPVTATVAADLTKFAGDAKDFRTIYDLLTPHLEGESLGFSGLIERSERIRLESARAFKKEQAMIAKLREKGIDALVAWINGTDTKKKQMKRSEKTTSSQKTRKPKSKAARKK